MQSSLRIQNVDEEEDDGESEVDEHVFMLTKQFRKFLKGNKKGKSSKPQL